MTREERKKAIEVLDDMKVKIDIPKAAKTQNDRNWALDVAIEALSQEPQCTEHPCLGTLCRYYKESCDDAISREAVDELSKELVHTTRDKADFLCNFWEGLRKLPSVTQKPIECEDKEESEE